MAFSNDLDTNVGKVRFIIGDDVENEGILPDGSNFTDEQIQHAIDETGGNGKAAVFLAQSLAARYASMVTFAVGPRRENLSDAHKQWKEQAENLKDQYGSIGAGHGVTVAPVIRVDGYSDDVASDEVT